MQLLSSNFSPYSTRVRILIAKQQHQVEITAPDFALRSPEFLAKYPLGKIPVLKLSDSEYLSESWAIMQYLDALSEQSLSPSAPLANARMHEWLRYVDQHLAPSLLPLFGQLLGGPAIDVDAQMQKVRAELDKGERLLSSNNRELKPLDLADIATAAVMYFVVATPAQFGEMNILKDFPKLSAWWQRVLQDPEIETGVSEMRQAFEGFLKK